MLIKKSIRDKFDIHFFEILTGASKALIVRIGGAILSFSFSFFLIRFIGAKEAGVYFLSLTIVTIASVLSCLGMNITLVREIAYNNSTAEWDKINSVYFMAVSLGSVASILSTIIIIIFASMLSETVFNEPRLHYLLIIMSLAILPNTLSILHSSSLRGKKLIVQSMIILNASNSFFTLVGLFIFRSNELITIGWIFVASSYLTFLVARYFWITHKKFFGKKKMKEYNVKKMLKTSFPIFIVDVSQIFIVRFSIIILGIYVTSDKIALYNIANRTAILLSFLLVAINSIAGPKIAELFKNYQYEDLKKLTNNISKLMIIVSLFPFLVFFFFSKEIMSFFSTEFISDSYILKILSFGQFVYISMGVSGLLLTMTENEKLWRNVIVIAAVFSIILQLIFVPFWGILGASISQSLTLIIQVSLSLVFVWKKFKILPFPMNILFDL